VCGKHLEPEQNFWSVDAGGAVCPSCGDDSLRLAPLSLNALKLLRLLQRSPFEEVTRVRVSGALASELETCLGDYVRYVLEREVRSARFVETLRQTRVAPPV
jgi:DNA repair protein RecO (recombination protein O)